MSERAASLAYLRHYANKDLDAIAPMFAEDIVLRDWTVCVHGKTQALAETRKNFEAAGRIDIAVLAVHESPGSVAAELRIAIDGVQTLHVVDVIDFNAAGQICGIRAYLGRGDA